MKLKYILFLFFVLSFSIARAQDENKKKFRIASTPPFVFELGGNGGLYSINYQKHIIAVTRETNVYWSCGFSLVPIGKRAVVDFPLSLCYWDSRGFEIGTGQVFIASIGGGKGGTIRGTFRIGYKKHHWGASYTPFYSYLNNFQWEHWFGISYAFKIKRKS